MGRAKRKRVATMKRRAGRIRRRYTTLIIHHEVTVYGGFTMPVDQTHVTVHPRILDSVPIEAIEAFLEKL
jgi:hypothetical protein